MTRGHTSIPRQSIQKAPHCNLQRTPVAPAAAPGELGRELILPTKIAKTKSQFRTTQFFQHSNEIHQNFQSSLLGAAPSAFRGCGFRLNSTQLNSIQLNSIQLNSIQLNTTQSIRPSRSLVQQPPIWSAALPRRFSDRANPLNNPLTPPQPIPPLDFFNPISRTQHNFITPRLCTSLPTI
jgi:hypothetical protein